LLKIKGVGPEKRRALLNAFGSVQGVRDAGVDAIALLPGFSKASAERLLVALAPQSEAAASADTPHAEPSEPLPPDDVSDVTEDTSATSETPAAPEIVEQG
jgi:excinuclease ABC subunit C